MNYFLITEGEYSMYSFDGILITDAEEETIIKALETPIPYKNKTYSPGYLDMDRPRSFNDLVEVLRVSGYNAEWIVPDEINLDDLKYDNRPTKLTKETDIDFTDPNIRELFGRINKDPS